jgi:hypothetical protein
MALLLPEEENKELEPDNEDGLVQVPGMIQWQMAAARMEALDLTYCRRFWITMSRH